MDPNGGQAFCGTMHNAYETTNPPANVTDSNISCTKNALSLYKESAFRNIKIICLYKVFFFWNKKLIFWNIKFIFLWGKI
jgi:hypothetical protein